MADNGNIDHHKSIKYVEAEIEAPAGAFTVTQADGGRGVRVSGTCPACGGRTTTEFRYGTGGTKGWRGPTTTPDRPRLGSATVFCECGHAHADRPDDAIDRGCGRFWAVGLGLE